jgi:hypothetical protein
MASPFNVFRKNQRTMMVVIGVGCMIGFLLGGMGIIEGVRPGMGGSDENPLVVSWDGGQLTQQEIDQYKLQRNLAVRYLATIAQQAMENGGTPKGPGVVVDPQQGVVRVGISQDTSDSAIVQTQLLADKAEKMGFTVTDDDVKKFILGVSDESISNNDLAAILERVGGDRMSDAQLFDTLRYELLAQKLQMLGSQSGMVFSTPGEMWQYYNRLNRRIDAEVIPLPVSDFTSKVPQPTTAQLRAFYEQHKNQVSHPMMSEPGFSMRQKIAFGYYQANIDSFMEGPQGELAKVTDEEIQAYYEANKDASFRERELPSFDEPATGNPATGNPATGGPATAPPGDPTTPAGETELTPPENTQPDNTQSDSTQPDNTEADSPATDAPADPAAPTADTPAAEQPAEEAPADSPVEEVPVDSNPAESNPADAETDESTSQRGEIAPGAALFVSYRLQEEQPAADDEPAAADDAATDSPAQPADAADPDAEPPAAGPDAESNQPVTPPAADEAPPAQTPATETPATETPATETPATEATPGPADPADSPAPTKPKYTPLEKVEDEIRRSIAQPRAFQRMNAALESARKQLAPYAELYTNIHALSSPTFDDNKQAQEQLKAYQEKFAASRPNYQAIADRLGLTYAEIPLSDPFEVQQYPLGQFTYFDSRRRAMVSFPELAYGEGVPYQLEILGDQRDEQFLFWSTDRQDPRVPEFSEVYDEKTKSGPVLEAWKMQQALPLAKERAAELAAKSNKTDQTLQMQFEGQENITVLKTNQFSWLTTGSTASDFGRPQISPVASVDTPGIEFMESVFSLEVGAAGVAVNHPHTVVYVVHVTSQSPPSEALRSQFAASQYSSDVIQQYVISQVTLNDRSVAYQAWMDDIERELDVQWMR